MKAVPVLSPGEEKRLFDDLRDDDKRAAARDRLVESHLPLVARVARKFEGRGMDLDDLVGEGNLGLFGAADRFDPAFGVRFSTYAEYWVKRAILQAFKGTAGTIRLPSHVVNLLTKYRRAGQELARRFGREPGFDEVADSLGLTGSQRSHVEAGLAARRFRPKTRVAGVEKDDWNELSCEPTDAEVEADDERQCLRRRLGRLDDRARAIVTMRFGLGGRDPLSAAEAGRAHGIGHERVRQIVKASVELMRSSA